MSGYEHIRRWDATISLNLTNNRNLYCKHECTLSIVAVCTATETAESDLNLNGSGHDMSSEAVRGTSCTTHNVESLIKVSIKKNISSTYPQCAQFEREYGIFSEHENVRIRSCEWKDLLWLKWITNKAIHFLYLVHFYDLSCISDHIGNPYWTSVIGYGDIETQRHRHLINKNFILLCIFICFHKMKINRLILDCDRYFQGMKLELSILSQTLNNLSKRC